MLTIFLILLGILLLYFGGEFLVDQSIGLASKFGLSSLVIGLTVVAFATSSPELAATIAAVLEGSPDIAVGNVFGSNIANIGLILGLSAMMMPITADPRLLRRETPFMILATILVYPVMAIGEQLARLEGFALFCLLLFFLYNSLQSRGRKKDEQTLEERKRDRPTWLWILGIFLAVGILVAGAESLVIGASRGARVLGVPERIIGLTVVAFGTSLPELAASLVAVRRGEAELVLGNLIGSNIFNLLCILGVTAMIKPIAIAPEALQTDYAAMLGISVILMIFLALHSKVLRIEGAVLVALYSSYILYLFL